MDPPIFPRPRIPGRRARPGLQPVLDWKIGQFFPRERHRFVSPIKRPLNAKGEKLHARLSYDPTGPRYKGEVSIKPLDLNVRKIRPLHMNVDLILGLEKNRIEISNAKIDLPRSHVEANGSIEDLSSPKAAFRFTARVAAAEAGYVLDIPAARQGTIGLAGTFKYNSSSDYTIVAGATLRGIEIEEDGIHFSGVRGTTLARLNPRGLELDSIALETLGGHFTGRASLPKLESIVADGAVRDILIQPALAALVPQLTEAERTVYSGAASGPIHLESPLKGGFGFAAANVVIEPAPGGIPVQGTADIRYDGKSQTLSVAKSHLEFPGVRADLPGVLNEQMDVRADSDNLDDLLPAINAFSTEPVKSLPIQLKGGKASFTGTVAGKLKLAACRRRGDADEFRLLRHPVRPLRRAGDC